MATLSDGSFTYYRSVMVYGGDDNSDEHLLYITHPDGITAYDANGNFTYKYFFNDYMGNVRSVVAVDTNTATLIEEQATDYYPFGLAHSYNNLHKNRYLFSGKELQDASVGTSGFLGLYDFGSRYYNPMLGRWFNIDPALQTTNPYLFCGNAPMVYVDPDGRWFIIDDLFAAAIGGVFNVISGLITGDINSWGHGFASFGAGALAGWGALYVGPVATGALLNASNSVLSQGFNNGWSNINGSAVLFSGFTGAATAYGGAALSKALAPVLKSVTGGITSPVLRESINQGVTGSASGFVVGSGVAALNGASFEDAMGAGGTSALFGLSVGIINGTASGIKYAKENNLNAWSEAAREGTGQKHHLISRKIERELNKNSNLKGVINRTDPEFMYKAKDGDAHKGYQKWHREYDTQVVKWMQEHPNATSFEFRGYLHNIHQSGALKHHVPGVEIQH